jgi:hypothetical protein
MAVPTRAFARHHGVLQSSTAVAACNGNGMEAETEAFRIYPANEACMWGEPRTCPVRRVQTTRAFSAFCWQTDATTEWQAAHYRTLQESCGQDEAWEGYSDLVTPRLPSIIYRSDALWNIIE